MVLWWSAPKGFDSHDSLRRLCATDFPMVSQWVAKKRRRLTDEQICCAFVAAFALLMTVCCAVRERSEEAELYSHVRA